MVNTARGGLVVDDDLIAALKTGRVAAAGLDVFEGEPQLHPEYVSLKNTFLLPHIGSATIETRTAMGMLALDNVDAVLSGGSPPTLVPPSSQFDLLTNSLNIQEKECLKYEQQESSGSGDRGPR